MKHLLLASVLALTLSAAAEAQDSDAQKEESAKAFLASLDFKQGTITVPGSNARVDLGPDFRYLDQADADKVLEHFWRNPHDDSVLAMIVPTATPLSDEHSWGVVVTRSDDGHVSDDDAAKIDYDDMLMGMQKADAEDNEQRKKAGYPEIKLMGWAEPPHYDAAHKKLYWARELATSDASQHTLNYDIRVLGRSGYVSLNAVAGMNDLAIVQTGMQKLLPRVDFEPGQRYADFNSSTDKVAAYGLAALVAGGIAAKAGLFAKIGLMLLAFKKVVVVGVIAVGAAIKKFFGRGNGGGTVT